MVTVEFKWAYSANRALQYSKSKGIRLKMRHLCVSPAAVYKPIDAAY